MLGQALKAVNLYAVAMNGHELFVGLAVEGLFDLEQIRELFLGKVSAPKKKKKLLNLHIILSLT